MEKGMRSFNEMYRYINHGETLYDLLEEYTGEKDFSAAGIINSFRRNLNLQQNEPERESERRKFIALVNTYNKDINGRMLKSMDKNMTVEEKQELLKRFQAVNPEKYGFSSILEYTNFLEDVNFSRSALILDRNDDNAPPVLNPEIEELNQILIGAAVEKADPELVAKLRNVLIHMMLIPYAKKQILKESSEPDEVQNSKLEKIEFFNKMFFNEKAIQEYDLAIAYVKELEEEAKKAAQLTADCKLRRLSALSSLTGVPMPEVLAKVDSNDESLIDAITVKHEENSGAYVPVEGDYYWRIVPFKNPRVIMDEPIEYSKDGVENQEVLVASYGDFSYGKALRDSRYDEMPLELIGVTLFGNDDNRNYFLITPKSNIINMMNGKNKEYYKKVLLSSFVLDETTMEKDKFLPEISLDENGNASLEYEREMSLLNLKPTDAVKYANVFPGQFGREYRPITLKELCNSQELFGRQMDLIYELRQRQQRVVGKPLAGNIERHGEDIGEY